MTTSIRHLLLIAAASASAFLGGSLSNRKAVIAASARFLNVQDYGALPNDGQSDSAAIAAAIAALPARGGSVWFPAGTYTITATINIGNGNGSNVSSRTGIKLIGEGAGLGQAASDAEVPTKLDWAGPAQGVVISLNGRISSCSVQGFLIDCGDSANAGLRMTAASGCVMEDLKILRFCDVGVAVLGGNAFGNYNIHNQFRRILVSSVRPQTHCLFMDGAYQYSSDTWISSFELCRFEAKSSGLHHVTGAWLKFVDSVTFTRCHFDVSDPDPNPANPTTNNYGVVFDALANDAFPAGVMFHDCSVINTRVAEDSGHHIRKNFFYGYGTYDSEIKPMHPMLLGITDKGELFGSWGP